MPSDKRLTSLLAVIGLAILGVFARQPIAQTPAYHQFADTRMWLTIPNFLNVVSNAPFIIVGWLGLRAIVNNATDSRIRDYKALYLPFFAGVLLTGFGSAYYHYHPDNFGLFLDRLPLAISLMAFFCLVLADSVSPVLAKHLLTPLLLTGLSSVCYWYVSELMQQSDLRAYVLVQFLPIALIPIVMWLFREKRRHYTYIYQVLGAYVLAKVCEAMDRQIYDQLIIVSGHTLKHLFAALGTYFVYADLSKKLAG